MLPEQQERILGNFIKEARDHLNTIEQGLLNLQSTLQNPKMLKEIFRAAHSIKGSAAMLGLNSIQHTSHRLEDCFKVLQEHPVQVDQKLESLFLGVCDTLKVLLEHLSEPFGLSEEAANNLILETESVFKWLHEHLELLVEQTGNRVKKENITTAEPGAQDSVSTLIELFLRPDIINWEEDTEITSTESSVSMVNQQQDLLIPTQCADNWDEFETQVSQTLREMLQLFKKNTTPASRNNLQQCCQQLVKLGQRWNLLHWSSLCQAATNAIANPENTYLTLAKIVITEIKQAQELVLQGRETEIATSQQLAALLKQEFVFVHQPGDVVERTAHEEFSSVRENLSSKYAISQLTAAPDSITSLTEIAGKFQSSEDILDTIENTVPETVFTEMFSLVQKGDPDISNIGDSWSLVGLAELNTSVDLFEGEKPELDEPCQQQENSNIDHNFGDTEHQERQNQQTCARVYSKSQDSSADINPNDVINGLLAVTQDEEVKQPEPVSNNQKKSYDDLLLETNDADIQDIFRDDYIEFQPNILQPESLNLDALFDDFVDVEDQPQICSNDGEIINLFEIIPTPIIELKDTEDNLNDFWNQESATQQENKAVSVLEEDVAKALDDSLLAGVADDIFGSVEESQPKHSASINNDNISLHEQNLLFPSDDLFADLSDSHSAESRGFQAGINQRDNHTIASFDVDEGFGYVEKLLTEADKIISHLSQIKPKQHISKIPPLLNRRTARFEETMKVSVRQLDDISNLVGELVLKRNTLEQDHQQLRQSLDKLFIQVQQLSEVGAKMQESYERLLLEAPLLAIRKTKEPQRHPRTNHKNNDSHTDRGFSELEMDRFTPFHRLFQQMIEFIVRVRESASDIHFVTEETERVARQFRQVTKQLQEGLTRARMVPFCETIDGLRRGVRDNAIKYGKQVELVISGGDTLIDKMILDRLTDPLTHMLNNAIAHGIETPQIREKCGKPPVGYITICAFHQGSQTVISVGDDGAGIDPERIKAKAIQMGMITPAEAKSISPMEIYDLLFQPGFSIKDKADEIAGRGIGMDIVRSAIREMRGIVNIDSTVGKGTTFTIQLPLTLSICKALCCVFDQVQIALPMEGVEDTLDVPVKSIQHNADGQSYIYWRDRMLPCPPLKELLTFNRQISRGSVYGGNRDDDMVSLVVVRLPPAMRSAQWGNNLIALQIDKVLSEQEIVIKQFEPPAPKPIGVAGATILDDGRIMPIADVVEIIDIFQGRISRQNGSNPRQQLEIPHVSETRAKKIDPTVLIVDDSITVRKLLSLTFNKAGYRVEQARDGQEAWDKLRSGLPCDIVFCDIEMPRCDGLELLSRIQKDPNLNHIPIAMLTSGRADKHRQMAIQLGATGYLTKPYLEEVLLQAAVRMLTGEKIVSS
ncbi:hybrid sensor histidine kinase/response regulator [Umezakia ovalisporum]|uniref:hybrid sensor histidine kinase/response regulator n=1 Tax=Umezakia ovalisporum TaxID=75695 RepID=UPI0024760A23|nr:response regulator [Umezakia ovalisporum]MBI1243093.1 response regulator [Nostoc sp. RI_552]MDH6084729.1 response regulator [Umezakia ovalisporum TAC611]